VNVEKDFEKFFALLNRYNVRYCVIGAYAVAFHAMPRATGDMDIVIEPNLANARKVIQVLKAFGFKSLKIQERDLCKKDQIIPLGYPPVRIDLLTTISGVDFSQIWKHRKINQYGRQKVWVMGKKELVANKLASGRPKDMWDLQVLKGGQ